MRNSKIDEIVLLGAGNVAWHMSGWINKHKHKHKITQVYNRSLKNAVEIAQTSNCNYTDSLEKLYREADLYIIAISDDSILPLIPYLKNLKGIVVHTAGSVGIDIFKNYVSNYGVIYPYQTLTKSVESYQKNIPICIEANNSINRDKIRSFVFNFSNVIYDINSDQRKTLHLAGVISNNFINHLIAESNSILENANIPKEIMHPLLEETFQRALYRNPLEVQTGPAVRNNQVIIQKHLAMLSENIPLQEIYKSISENIFRVHSDKSES